MGYSNTPSIIRPHHQIQQLQQLQYDLDARRDSGALTDYIIENARRGSQPVISIRSQIPPEIEGTRSNNKVLACVLILMVIAVVIVFVSMKLVAGTDSMETGERHRCGTAGGQQNYR